MKRIHRRIFLRGAFGAMVALPLLESIGADKSAKAAGYDPFLFIMRQGNGCQQKTDDEPERFWPDTPGPLTTAGMQAMGDRTVVQLADYASKMTLVRGVNFAFPGNGCGHSGGGNQVLTAAKVSTDLSGAQSLGMGESIDNLVARTFHPTIEPLTLYAGPKYGYLDEVLSYRGPEMLRGAEQHPFKVYQDLFKLGTLDPKLLEELKTRRKSVNDLVRAELTALLARKDLSKDDRGRIDLHLSSIRDLEVNACGLPDQSITDMMALDGAAGDNDNIETIAKQHMDVIALALSCGAVRSATLQIGSGNCGAQFYLMGVKQYSFHWISHRIQGDGDTGDPIPGADLKHHEIDKVHANLFKYMCDKLASYTLGSASLLDAGVSIWVNDLADKYHSYHNVPHVLVGGGNGYLKTGQFLDLEPGGSVNNNQLWNTVGSAVGIKSAGQQQLVDFGDPSLKQGVISEMIA